MSRCRSCDAEIVWGLLPSGKRMPLNPEPDENGNVEVLQDLSGQVTIVQVHRGPDVHGAVRYLSHFATCPRAKEHRR